MSQARFQKRMREKARQDKARAKRQRKEDRTAAAEATADTDGDEEPAAPQTAVLAELADLHQRFDADDIDFDEFEQRKHELLAQLDV
jgi:Gas vesicle protein G